MGKTGLDAGPSPMLAGVPELSSALTPAPSPKLTKYLSTAFSEMTNGLQAGVSLAQNLKWQVT